MNETTPDPSAFEASEAGSVAPLDQTSSDAIDVAGDAPSTVDAQRHAAMTAAAAAIGSVPPLDEVTRSRLVRAALAALVAVEPEVDQWVPTRARRSTRWLVPVGSVAAAGALVVGVVAMAGNSNDPAVPAARSSDQPVAVAESDGAPMSVDLGEVSDPAVLRRLVADDASDATALSGESFTKGPIEVPTGGSREAADVSIPSDDCLRSIDPDLALVLLGTATYAGEPAVVATGRTPSATTVYVIGAECTILSSLQVAADVDRP
jgi:hypothetical protein